MKNVAMIFAAFVSVVLMSAPARAPIFGWYPGMSGMIRGSDDIVVARIVAEPTELSAMGAYGGFEDYVIEVLYTLKGDVSPSAFMVESGAFMKVSLRHLPLLSPSGAASTALLDTALSKPFRSNERYVLFLENDRHGTVRRNRNEAGSSFWVAPTFDPSTLNHGDIRGSIEQLVGEVVAYERLRVRNLEDAAAKYLAE